MTFNPFARAMAMLRAEPIQAQAMVQTGVALGCAFGLSFSAVQIAAVVAFTASVLAFVTRQAVTPMVSLPSAGVSFDAGAPAPAPDPNYGPDADAGLPPPPKP
jgi:hypothetical protein